MAKSSLLNGPQGSGEGIAHCNAVRLRVVGSGDLLLTLKSLDDTVYQDLETFTMVSATDKQPTRLANFKNQRIALEVGTSGIDQWFKINRIVIFIKSIYTEYPSSFSN